MPAQCLSKEVPNHVSPGIKQTFTYRTIMARACMLLQARTEMGSTPVARTDSGQMPEVPAAPPSRLVMHAMFWLAGALPAYWLLQQHTVPSISRKFIWTVAAPVSSVHSTSQQSMHRPRIHRFSACSVTFPPPVPQALTAFCEDVLSASLWACFGIFLAAQMQRIDDRRINLRV